MNITTLSASEKQIAKKFDALCDELRSECSSCSYVHYSGTLRHNISEMADIAEGYANRFEQLAAEMEEIAKSDESSAGLPIGDDDILNLWDYRLAAWDEETAGMTCAECLRCCWRLEYTGGPGHRFCMLRGERTNGRRTCNAFEAPRS